MPYNNSEKVPFMTVTSAHFGEGDRLAEPQGSGIFGVPGGLDESPHLSWSGVPEGTKSFAVTMFDPDAPIPSGFWHWGLVDLPAGVTELPAGAGESDAQLPEPAFHLANETGGKRYIGFAPPPGTGRHRYVFAVHALDVESVRELGVGEDTTIAVFHFLVRGHTLARGLTQAWASADE